MVVKEAVVVCFNFLKELKKIIWSVSQDKHKILRIAAGCPEFRTVLIATEPDCYLR